jgi:uncharacterized protein
VLCQSVNCCCRLPRLDLFFPRTLPMRPSRFNIISRIKDSSSYFIVNILSGQADILSVGEMLFLSGGSSDIPEEFTQKGYWVNPGEEDLEYRLRYIDYLEQREQEEVQVFFAPTYQCNFGCSYCYQSGYEASPEQLKAGVVDAFFHLLEKQLKHRRKYVTLFGGEPLLPGKSYQASLQYFFDGCKAHGIDLSVVTNGYHLTEYLPMLQGISIREIQLTLDGPETVHNRRRPLHGGQPTFTRIAEGLDRCLEKGIPVNLRMVLDRDNIHSLPGLARIAIDRGWTSNPLFKTQLGRNYELHYCQSSRQKLYSRLELYQDIYGILARHPEILEFHRPAFSVARFLKDNGELPAPLFDACPACKSEWALDYTGRVYSCTATVGKPGEALGTFFPEIKLDHQAIYAWQQRDVTAIEKCKDCNIQLACGGGCGSVAKNQHGYLHAPDCRPVKELLELGMGFYFRDADNQ